MNVFVRVYSDSPLRSALAEAVVCRLNMECSPILIAAEDVNHWPAGMPMHRHWVEKEDFHRTSKAKAAELATTDWLLIVDDDQLPLYRDWVGYAVSLTKRFPEYSAIAGWSVTHEVPRPAALIEPSDSIGCPMIVRRAALLDATSEPIDNTARADTILTQRLQRHGKTGIARNWRYNHLGMGYSQCIPAHWMPECPV